MDLRELGWQPFFDEQVDFEELNSLLAVRVFAHFGSRLLVASTEEEYSIPYPLVTARMEQGCGDEPVAVGDWFLVTQQDQHVVKRLTRKTVLARKAAGDTVKPQLIASNIDTVFIVSSCNHDFNPSRLERYLALVLESEATPVVVLTKSDLHDDPHSLSQIAAALHPGLVVETINALDPEQASVLEYWCRKGQTIAMLGSSGVGKSTLANTLCGKSIKTQGSREDDSKGRHTTTARYMHPLAAGGWLIDTPGMRELQLADCEDGVNQVFEDLVLLADQCQFRNCSHQGDHGCALESAVESGELDARRLTNYLKLLSEQARNSASLAERRERERKTGKMYKRILSEKQKRRQ